MPVRRLVRTRQPVSHHLRYEASDRGSTEEVREELLKCLVHRKLLGATQQIQDMMSPDRLPLRELPPGSTSTLYLMYLASMKVTSEKACGKSTFYQVAKSWSRCLRFRHASQHSMCAECARLKHMIAGATDPCLQIWFKRLSKDFALHARACDALLSHYSDQYADRRVYWAARERSRTHYDIMCAIQDSFDRAKLSLPQWPLRRTPKRACYEITNRNMTAVDFNF